MFRFDKLTQKAQEAFQQAQQIAEKHEHQAIHPLHLLIALAGERDGIVRPVLEKCGVQPDAIVQEAEKLLASVPRVSGAQTGVYLSPSLNAAMEKAFEEATHFKDEFVSTEHLLLALSQQKNDPAGNLLDRAGAGHDVILKALVAVRGHAAHYRPESRIQISGARALRGRSDGAGAQGQARSGDRAQRRNPPRDAGAEPPHQEQPGADRRARRGQDRHRRRPGPAHREWRCAGAAAQQAPGLARPGLDGGRHQVPRRVRRPPESRAERNHRIFGRDPVLHRRAAHAGGSRGGRRRDRRRQHAETGAGARRAALHRRDHAQRISQVRREGRRAGPPLPNGAGWRAVGGRHGRDSARAEGTPGNSSRRAHQGFRHRGGGDAVAIATSPTASCRTKPSI